MASHIVSKMNAAMATSSMSLTVEMSVRRLTCDSLLNFWVSRISVFDLACWTTGVPSGVSGRCTGSPHTWIESSGTHQSIKPPGNPEIASQTGFSIAVHILPFPDHPIE
jgi:hypothetical protein